MRFLFLIFRVDLCRRFLLCTKTFLKLLPAAKQTQKSGKPKSSIVRNVIFQLVELTLDKSKESEEFKATCLNANLSVEASIGRALTPRT